MRGWYFSPILNLLLGVNVGHLNQLTLAVRMEEAEPYDHKVVIILCRDVNEPQFFRLAMCNLPVGFSRHYHMCLRSSIRHFFSIAYIGRDSFLQRISASLPVGQNRKFFHQRSKFPSREAHWCFQKLFSFMSNVPSQLLVFLWLSV